MHAQFLLVGTIAGLSSAAALPSLSSRNIDRRGQCIDGGYCADCVATNSCGDQALSVGFKPDNLEVGDVNLDDISNGIAGSCYPGSAGLSSCRASDYEIETTLENGDAAKLIINYDAQGYPTWAQNLLIDGFKAAIDKSAKRNTITGEGPTGGSRTVTTIPSSLTLALFDEPDQSIVISIAVELLPQDEGICADVLSVGAALAGLAGTGGAAVGAGLTFASIFCN